MENQRDDLVVILAGYKDRMDTFFKSNPGLSSRIAHHIDFPDYTQGELLQIGERMLQGMNYRFGAGAREVFDEYLGLRLKQPHFANARSVRNALDRARLRHHVGAQRITQRAKCNDARNGLAGQRDVQDQRVQVATGGGEASAFLDQVAGQRPAVRQGHGGLFRGQGS